MGKAIGPYFAVAQGYHNNPKARRAGLRGRALHLAAIDYSTRNGLDGLITAEAMRIVLAEAGVTKATVTLLVDIRLLEVVENGWKVHDISDWQKTAEEVRDITSKRRAAQAAGNTNRWHKPPEPPDRPVTSVSTNAPQQAHKSLTVKGVVKELSTSTTGERVVTAACARETAGRNWVSVFRAARLAIGITWTDANAEREIDDGAEEAIALGVDPGVVAEAIGDLARNQEAAPCRLDLDVTRVLQRRAEVPLPPRPQRVNAIDERAGLSSLLRVAQ